MKIDGLKHVIFNQDLFQCESYNAYVQRLKQYLSYQVAPSESRLQDLVPEITEKLDHIHNDLRGIINNVTQEMKAEVQTAMDSSFSKQIGGLVRRLASCYEENGRIDDHAASSTTSKRIRPANLVEPVEDSPDEDINGLATTFSLHGHYHSCSKIYNEWYGLEEFDGTINSKYYPGGLALLEKDKTGCRCDFTSAQETNGHMKLYGRVMRHREVNLCAVGALGLYLFARFHLAKEVIDFSTNSSWFDVKLLVQAGSRNTVNGISDTNYAKAIKRVISPIVVIGH
jgi:hypothetical protein